MVYRRLEQKRAGLAQRTRYTQSARYGGGQLQIRCVRYIDSGEMRTRRGTGGYGAKSSSGSMLVIRWGTQQVGIYPVRCCRRMRGAVR
jgi:hypothetical protein